MGDPLPSAEEDVCGHCGRAGCANARHMLAVVTSPVANGHRWPCAGFYTGNHEPIRAGAWTCTCTPIPPGEGASDARP